MKTKLTVQLTRVFAASLMILVCSVSGSESQSKLETSMVGLSGVRVVIEQLESDLEQDGLTMRQLQTDAELRLRKAGIPVREDYSTVLYISVSTIKGQSREFFYAYAIRVELRQNAWLDRNPKILVPGVATWEAATLGFIPVREVVREIRNNVNDFVDEFINKYLAANPKPSR